VLSILRYIVELYIDLHHTPYHRFFSCLGRQQEIYYILKLIQ